MEKSELVRSIPLKQIMVPEDVQLRSTPLDPERVAMFTELYHDEGKGATRVPPLEVFLLQGGDPAAALYPLVEGRHRFEALNELKSKEARVIVHTDYTFTLEDAEARHLKHQLWLMGLSLNCRHGKPLTREEKIAAVMRLKDFGSGIEEIAATGVAPIRTLYRWIEDEDKKKKEAEKQRILAFHEEGKSQREIAAELAKEMEAATRQSTEPSAMLSKVNRTLKKGKKHADHSATDKTLGGSSGVSFFPNGKNQTPPTTKDEEPVSDLAQVAEVLDGLQEIIERADPSEELEARLRLNFLPYLADKFPTIRQMIDKQGDPFEILDLRADYEVVYEQLKRRNIEVVELKDEVAGLKAQLKRRSENCTSSCEYTYERLAKEVGRLHDFILARAKEHIDVMGGVGPETQRIIRQLTYDFVLPGISFFEWTAENGLLLTTSATIRRFGEFEETLEAAGLINPLIKKRLDQLHSLLAPLAARLNNAEEEVAEHVAS